MLGKSIDPIDTYFDKARLKKKVVFLSTTAADLHEYHHSVDVMQPLFFGASCVCSSTQFLCFLFFPAFRSSETGARGADLSAPEAPKHR